MDMVRVLQTCGDSFGGRIKSAYVNIAYTSFNGVRLHDSVEVYFKTSIHFKTLRHTS